MEAQLQELIDKIKKEGVETGEQEAERIVAEAKQKADSIISDAEKKAKSMVEQAQRDVQQREQAGTEALQQASRDLLIALEKKISAVFDEVVRKNVEETMSGSSLESIIITLVSEWVKNNSADIAVLLPEGEQKKLEQNLRGKLKEEFKKGVEIKVSDSVKSGFLIGEKDGSSYYNFSAAGVAEIISEFVNPKLAETVRRAAEQE